MGFRYISVFLKLMFHQQYTRHHRTAVQDCHIPEFGFGLHLHKLQDIRQLPNQSHQFAIRPNHHELGMGFPYNFVFQKLNQNIRPHQIAEQDCRMLGFGLDLRLHNLLSKLPNRPSCSIHH
jgi:hypothetical protein